MHEGRCYRVDLLFGCLQVDVQKPSKADPRIPIWSNLLIGILDDPKTGDFRSSDPPLFSTLYRMVAFTMREMLEDNRAQRRALGLTVDF